MWLRSSMLFYICKTLGLIRRMAWGWDQQSLVLPGEAYKVHTILPQALYGSTCKIAPTKTPCPTLEVWAGISVIPTDLSFTPSRELTGPRSQSSKSMHFSINRLTI